MIVRIATEGQYQLPDDELERLNQLDDDVVAAVESADGAEFARRLTALLDHARSGQALDDDHLAPSDLILPPPDLTLDEATHEFVGEGLIPD